MKQSAGQNGPLPLPPFLNMMTRFGGRPARLLFWVLGLGLLFFGLHLCVKFFYLEARVLMLMPFLAQRVSLETLQKEPGKYNERWVRVEGLLWQKHESQGLLVPVASGPEPQSAGNAETSVAPLPPVKLEVRHPFMKSSKTMDFDFSDPQIVVELAGEFQAAPQARGKVGAGAPTQGGPELVASAMIKPTQLIYWVPVVFRIIISIVFILVSLPFFILARTTRDATARSAQPASKPRDVLPRKISLSVLDKKSFLKRADKTFAQSAINYLNRQGFKTINLFTIPQHENYVILVAFHNPEKRVYAAVYQAFGEDDLGTLTREVDRWCEFIATYPSGAHVTSTNQKSRAVESASPPQRGIRYLPEAKLPDLWSAQLEAMAAVKKRPLPVSGPWFEMALLEAHMLDHLWRKTKMEKLSRADLLLVGRKLKHEGYETYAEKIVDALEKAAAQRKGKSG
jgi:hypothetical protein